MAQSAVAADFGQSLDVQRDSTAQVAFYLQMLVDVLTQFGNVVFRQVFYSDIGADPGFLQNIRSRFPSDAKDVGQSDLYALFSRQVDTSYTSNTFFAPP